ncbi:MAG: DNA topology modulation protein [Acidobacteriota bacterium]
MRKILIIGPGGSGKSTLARRLAERTGLPLIHLDALYWHAGWVPTPDVEWDQTVAELLREEAWIIDGNYGRTFPMRLAACDTVVFLDLPRLLCVWRVMKRRLQYGSRGRPDVPEGCPERLSVEFIWWVWDYRRRRRPKILEKLEAVKTQKRVFILSNQESIERFVTSFSYRPTPSNCWRGSDSSKCGSWRVP